MTTSADRAAAEIVRVLPRLLRFLHAGLQDYPLTLQQLRVLDAIADGDRSAGEVAAELGIRPPTLTGLADPLHQKGLISRERDPTAWRVVRLGLTPAGRDVYEAVLAVTRRQARNLVVHLAQSDQVGLSRALAALNEEVDRASAHAGSRARDQTQRSASKGVGPRKRAG